MRVLCYLTSSVHFAASIGGCVGCCIVGRRAKAKSRTCAPTTCATALENVATINAPSAAALADPLPKVSGDEINGVQLAVAEQGIMTVEPPQTCHGRASSPLGTADKIV